LRAFGPYLKAGVVCWQVKLCDPHLSALEMSFSLRGATQIYVYLLLRGALAATARIDPSG